MIRAAYFAFALICFSSGYARADNFTFSFTNSFGNVNGTVTGEIFGLINDGAPYAATSIVIAASYPDGLNPIDSNLTPTSWDTKVSNSFTESSGVITQSIFLASDGCGPPSTLCSEFGLDLIGSSGSGVLGVLNGEIWSRAVQGDVLTFKLVPAPPSAVPEPSAVYLLLTVLGVVAIVARRRHAQGLAVGPPPE